MAPLCTSCCVRFSSCSCSFKAAWDAATWACAALFLPMLRICSPRLTLSPSRTVQLRTGPSPGEAMRATRDAATEPVRSMVFEMATGVTVSVITTGRAFAFWGSLGAGEGSGAALGVAPTLRLTFSPGAWPWELPCVPEPYDQASAPVRAKSSTFSWYLDSCREIQPRHGRSKVRQGTKIVGFRKQQAPFGHRAHP